MSYPDLWTRVHGEPKQVGYHWKASCIISSAIQWSHLIQECVNISQSLLKLGKEQNPEAYRYFIMPSGHKSSSCETNPWAASVVAKRTSNLWSQWQHPVWFSGDTSTFFSWFTPVASIMILSSIVDNNVQRHTKIWYCRKIQMKESEPLLRRWFLRLYSCRTKVSRCHT